MAILGKERPSCVDGKIDPKCNGETERKARLRYCSVDISDCPPIDWSRAVYLRGCSSIGEFMHRKLQMDFSRQDKDLYIFLA